MRARATSCHALLYGLADALESRELVVGFGADGIQRSIGDDGLRSLLALAAHHVTLLQARLPRASCGAASTPACMHACIETTRACDTVPGR